MRIADGAKSICNPRLQVTGYRLQESPEKHDDDEPTLLSPFAVKIDVGCFLKKSNARSAPTTKWFVPLGVDPGTQQPESAAYLPE